MGYDFHTTRAANWTESERFPILEREWMAVVDADPMLSVDPLSYWERRNALGTVEHQRPVVWKGHPHQTRDCPVLWYAKGRIYRKAPDDHTLRKMVEIAHRLHARVVGDEAEEYGDGDAV